MKVNITIETTNDVDIKEAAKKLNMTEEGFLDFIKKGWEFLLSSMASKATMEHNDIFKVIKVEKISDI